MSEPKPLPTLRRGDVITAAYLNRLAGGAELARQALSGPRQIVPDDDGGPQEPATSQADTGTEIDVFVVFDEQLDTLACLRFPGGELVTVAKPYNLRGFVASRTVGSEDQIIMPAYVEGVGTPPSVNILAARVETQIAGVEWADLNIQGRMWAQV